MVFTDPQVSRKDINGIAEPTPDSGMHLVQEPTEVVDLTVDTDSPKARRTELSRGKGAGPSVGALSFDVRDPPRADAKQPVPTCPICLENIKAMSCGPCGYALLTGGFIFISRTCCSKFCCPSSESISTVLSPGAFSLG